MPAHQSYGPKQLGNELKIWAEGDLERRRSVYFTDQSPCFKIVIENRSEKSIELTTGAWVSYEESDTEVEPTEEQRIHALLKPGEQEEIEHEVDMLAYQGTAALTIDAVSLDEREEHIRYHRRSNAPFRLYTFMVYDRDYYKVNYLRPRWTQYIAVGLSVIVVLVGVFQAYLVFSGG